MHPYLYQFNRLNRLFIGRFKRSLKKRIPIQFHPFLQPSILLLLTLIPIYIVVRPISFAPSDAAQFEKAPVISGWDYQTNSKNPLQVSAKSSDLGGVISVGYNRSSLSFSLPFTKSEVIQTKANEIIYTSATSPISVRYQIEPEKLKEDIILKAPPRSSSFIIPIKAKNAEIQLGPDNKPIIVDDKTKQYLFHIEKPYAVDAKGIVTYAAKYRLETIDRKPETIIYPDNPGELTFLGGARSITQSKQYRLVLDVDLAWLQDKNRAYPVTVDPTITHDTTTEFAAGQSNRLKDTGSGISKTTALATGGTITYSNGYATHVFTSSGSFTPSENLTVQVLVVAGGGGGGNNGGGGGGGGGVVYNSSFSVSTGAKTVTVGNGGPAHTVGYNSVFDSITATGGGYGGSYSGSGTYENGSTGGSGGGGSGGYPSTAGSGGSPTSGQGYTGGNGSVSGNFGTGGGGGAGAVGNNASGTVAGSGGAGADYSSIFGTGFGVSGVVAGGGGGGAWGGTAAGGGSGGGGNGSTGSGAAGTANTGGGGGGTGSGGTGGAGGSGVVVVRYYIGFEDNIPSLTSYYQELGADINTLGLYHFSSSACTTDASGNSYTLTANGGIACLAGGMFGYKASGFATTPISYSNTTLLDRAMTTGTIEAWINPTNLSAVQTILYADSTSDTLLTLGTSGQINFSTSASTTLTTANSLVNVNTWTHVAVTWTSAGHKIYINGVEVASDVNTTTHTSQDYTTYIGVGSGGNTLPFSGSIDEIRISSIARTPEEIKLLASRRPYSVYTSDSIDLTSVSSWTSLNWTGNGFATGDGETATASANSALVAQWNFNSTSGTTAPNDAGTGTCGGTASDCDFTLNNFASTGSQDQATGTGWTANNKRWGAGAIMLSSVATADSLSRADPTSNVLDPNSSDLTIETWVNTYDVSSQILTNNNNNSTSCTNNGYYLGIDASGYAIFYLDTNGATAGCDVQITSTKKINDNTWHHLTATVTRGAIATLYIDGVANNTDVSVTSYSGITVSGIVYMGGNAGGYDGLLDVTRYYAKSLTASEILANYNSSRLELQTRVGSSSDPNDGTWEAWRPITSESVIDNMDNPLDWATPSATIWTAGALIATSSATLPLAEGTKSLKLQTGQTTSLSGVVGMWHLDETGGTGAYIKDATTNGNNGTPTGTTIAEGVSGKARIFDDSDDFIEISDHASLDIPTSGTIEAWIKTNANEANNWFLCKNGNYCLGVNATGALLFTGATAQDNAGTSLLAGTWHHVAVTNNNTTASYYVDGVAAGTDAVGWGTTLTNTLRIGRDGSTNYFDGLIDEVRISNSVRTAEEIAESYRLGRDHRISKTISSTDLSSSNKIPFSIASDRLGTFSQLTIGESNYANSEPDTNTYALLHLEEQTGTGAYLKDASSVGSHGTPTATTFTQGRIGKGRTFAYNTTDRIVTTQNIPQQPLTFSLWLQRSAAPAANIGIMENDTGTAGQYLFAIYLGTDGKLTLNKVSNNVSAPTTLAGTTVVTDGKWHHIAAVLDGANYYLYVDGKLDASTNSGNTTNLTLTPLLIGADRNSVTGYRMSCGCTIDEPRVDNIVRTANEIRQAYEIGARTHNITIDFKAKLGSGNLITGSGDLGFTVDETPYGSSAAAGHLFLGDKIIIKENYDGTEYIAQGTVSAVNTSTGAITVTAWDTGSTFPSGGYTAEATVFKWQREYFDITESLSTHRDALTRLTYRISDGAMGANVWLDDLRSSTGYLTNPLGSTITSSTGSRYFQYRTILSSTNPAVSSALTSVTLNYVTNAAPSTPTLSTTYQTDKVKTADQTPEFRFSTTDPDSNDLVYEIQWDTDASFPAATSKVSDTDAGFSNITSGGDTSPFTSGNTIAHTVQSNLTNDTIYFYRVRAKDPTGTNSWSSWSSIKSLTIDTSLTHNTWHETHADQFSTDTITNGLSISDANNSVIVNAGSTTIESMEYSSDANAQSAYVTNAIIASGGTETTSGVYRIHTFNSSGTLSVTSGGNVEALVVAGGGAGGADSGGGGGGGGGIQYNSSLAVSGQVSVTVGSGGNTTSGQGGNGQDSVFSTLTATGGGGGGYYTNGVPHNGSNGGSGGGAGGVYPSGTASGGSGSQGYAGGGTFASGNLPSGGGGGNSSVGQTLSSGIAGGNGGNGTTYTISGSSVVYAGGGGGFGSPAGTNGSTGANTGSGGPHASAGFSGVVIVRYPDLTLQSYSEATIKTEGTYSLKGIAKATNSLNKTFTRTIGSPIDLSNKDTVTFDLRSTRTGSNIKVGLHDSGGTTTEVTPNVTSANTFQEVSLDISGVSNANKDAIDQIIITIVNADADNTFYIDDLASPSPGTGTITSTSITAANIYNASHWHSLTYTDESGGNSTYQVLYDNSGTPTLISDSDLPGNSTGLTSASPINLLLSTTTYPILYIRSTLTDDGVDPILYDWGVSLNDDPNMPTLDVPTDTATSQNILPALKTTATDPDSDYLRYKIELCTNVGMTTDCQTFDQTSSQTGWSGQNTQTNTAYTSNTQATYTIQSALLAGTTYYWRSYAKDPGGTNTWSPTQSTPYSFTTNYAPNIPTLDAPLDTATNQSVLPVFKTTASDTESDYLRYKIELCTNVGMTTDCQTFDETSSQTGWSGQNTQTNTAYTSGTQATYTTQAQLTPNTTYYWRSYAKDPGGSNTWSQTQATPYSFTVVPPPATPAQCRNIVKNATNTQIALQWQDVATTENNYEIERSVDGAAFTLRSTEAANTTQYLDSVTNGHTYAYKIRARLTDIESHYVYSTNYCSTITLNLQTGNTGISGLKFQGLQIK